MLRLQFQNEQPLFIRKPRGKAIDDEREPGPAGPGKDLVKIFPEGPGEWS
jgi:hypothetical protein